jgi:hypothetical protein
MGPFVVHVTGTRFDVQWNPERDLLELTLEEGHVELSGCVFGSGYHLAAGKSVRASCKGSRFDVVDTGFLPPLTAAGSPPPEIAPSAPVSSTVSSTIDPAPLPSASARSSKRSRSWVGLAEEGKFADAFAVADAAGFESQCAQANGAELAMLADAARYAPDADKADYALKLLRRRFPGSKRARVAAFSLGRLEFDDRHAYQKAADWFRTYLKEQPGGPLAREARGRLMESLHRAGDSAGAREVARQYLVDYPSGPHADLARDLRGPAQP